MWAERLFALFLGTMVRRPSAKGTPCTSCLEKTGARGASLPWLRFPWGASPAGSLTCSNRRASMASLHVMKYGFMSRMSWRSFCKQGGSRQASSARTQGCPSVGHTGSPAHRRLASHPGGPRSECFTKAQNHSSRAGQDREARLPWPRKPSVPSALTRPHRQTTVWQPAASGPSQTSREIPVASPALALATQLAATVSSWVKRDLTPFTTSRETPSRPAGTAAPVCPRLPPYLLPHHWLREWPPATHSHGAHGSGCPAVRFSRGHMLEPKTWHKKKKNVTISKMYIDFMLK